MGGIRALNKPSFSLASSISRIAASHSISRSFSGYSLRRCARKPRTQDTQQCKTHEQCRCFLFGDSRCWPGRFFLRWLFFRLTVPRCISKLWAKMCVLARPQCPQIWSTARGLSTAARVRFHKRHPSIFEITHTTFGRKLEYPRSVRLRFLKSNELQIWALFWLGSVGNEAFWTLSNPFEIC